MKKIILFAAALVAFAACNKEQQSGTFEKGQKVTLNIDASSSTKVTSAEDGTGISFSWEEGDEIKVTVGGTSAKFTLKTGAGTSSATFEGEMPAGGDTFDVQYPYETPDITGQTYSSTEPIPHDMMLLKATGCSLSNPSFSLTAQNAVLQLNLWGIDQEISAIMLKDKDGYELAFILFEESIILPTTEANAQAFYMVVPAGTYEYSVVPWDEETYPICYFSTSSAKTLAANQIINMPAKEVKKPKFNITYTVDPTGKGSFEDEITEAYEEETVGLGFTPVSGYYFKSYEAKETTSGDPVSVDFDEFDPNGEFDMPYANVTVKAICVEDKFEVKEDYFEIPVGVESQVQIEITSTLAWEITELSGLYPSSWAGGTNGELTTETITITIEADQAVQYETFNITFTPDTYTVKTSGAGDIDVEIYCTD